MNENEIINGNCLDVMPTLDANSVDAVVTDPPYGLSFMGKAWDHGVPGTPFWKAALRVMKPGAYLLAFGGTRTFHRLTCAIEDAGFEVRDCLMWLYGSGFPKSLDVSKAIDKAAGAKREVVGKAIYGDGHVQNSVAPMGYQGNDPDDDTRMLTAPSTDAARQWSGWGTALKPAWEPIILARKPIEGTVAENVQKWGTGAINIDGSRIGTGDDRTPGGLNSKGFDTDTGSLNFRVNQSERPTGGRWPANVLLDEEAGRALDGQSGVMQPTARKRRGQYEGGSFAGGLKRNETEYSDTGGASRFFYCAKASKRERGEGNNHPTVKPISLLSYLTKLVTPKGGLILDPFIGSGSTAVAAVQNGFRFIGIEKEPTYAEIARVRVAAVRPALPLAV